jgi:putative nucleotidyltransferase with HDIG domain
MTANAQGTLLLLPPADGSGFDSVLMHAASAMSLHVEVVGDEDHLQESLSAFVDSGQCAVVLCAPCTEVGSAADVVYRLKAVGTTAAFVGYGDFDKAALAQLIRLGADDVIMPPVDAAELLAVIERAAKRAAARNQQEQAQDADHRQIAALKRCMKESEDRCRAARGVAIESLLMALASRELDAIPHCLRVQAYTARLAVLAGYPEGMREALGHAALLHDIGKIGMSDDVLFRDGWLTYNERQQLEPHAEFGGRIAERIEFLRSVAPIVRHHHERFDGQGYPDGLSGNRIPLGARIFSIADSLDAMTSDKPYRAGMTFEIAADEIHRCAGKQFDPELVESFASLAPSAWRDIRDEVMAGFRSRHPLFFFL